MRKDKSDGMKEATKEPRGTEKGRPSKGKQPSLKSDGMKVAAKGEKRGASVVPKVSKAKVR